MNTHNIYHEEITQLFPLPLVIWSYALLVEPLTLWLGFKPKLFEAVDSGQKVISNLDLLAYSQLQIEV